MGKMLWRWMKGTCKYPHLRNVIRTAVLEKIGTYTYSRKNTVAQYIATHPIMDLCLDTEMRTGLRTPTRWWDQEGLLFPGRLEEGEESGYGGGD